MKHNNIVRHFIEMNNKDNDQRGLSLSIRKWCIAWIWYSILSNHSIVHWVVINHCSIHIICLFLFNNSVVNVYQYFTTGCCVVLTAIFYVTWEMCISVQAHLYSRWDMWRGHNPINHTGSILSDLSSKVLIGKVLKTA